VEDSILPYSSFLLHITVTNFIFLFHFVCFLLFHYSFICSMNNRNNVLTDDVQSTPSGKELARLGL